MELEIKRPDHVVPSYSLTGDLLSYQRCRLQYRYHNGSALPPSRPVQLWFGEFLHGTLELVYRFWNEGNNKEIYSFATEWPCTKREWRGSSPEWVENDIGKFADIVEDSLRRQGKQARSSAARDSGYKRVSLAINELGPHLFPLIDAAEKKVIGTRKVPDSSVELRCSNYEVHGIIDVLTSMTLNQADTDNLIKKFVENACPDLTGEYEVVVDYKGSQRPNTNDDYWDHGEWQLHTYAWLRSHQPDSKPVAAGILIYINELTPGDAEMVNLKKAIAEGTTDIAPEMRSRDEQLIRQWRQGESTDQISLDFRLRRAIRVVPITHESTGGSLASFDDVVRRIEEDIINESVTGSILGAWAPQCSDESTCDACDFRHFCPRPAGSDSSYIPNAPSAP